MHSLELKPNDSLNKSAQYGPDTNMETQHPARSALTALLNIQAIKLRLKLRWSHGMAVFKYILILSTASKNHFNVDLDGGLWGIF